MSVLNLETLIASLIEEQKETRKQLTELQSEIRIISHSVKDIDKDEINNQITKIKAELAKHSMAIFGLNNKDGLDYRTSVVLKELAEIKQQQSEDRALAKQRILYLKYLWGGVLILGISNVWQLVEKFLHGTN
jgi:predicted DNA-binding ribbon-helix-helix protein